MRNTLALSLLEKSSILAIRNNPNINCPVGKNIHKALDDKFMKIQNSMYMQMNDIKIGDVYGDIIKEINTEA